MLKDDYLGTDAGTEHVQRSAWHLDSAGMGATGLQTVSPPPTWRHANQATAPQGMDISSAYITIIY